MSQNSSSETTYIQNKKVVQQTLDFYERRRISSVGSRDLIKVPLSAIPMEQLNIKNPWQLDQVPKDKNKRSRESPNDKEYTKNKKSALEANFSIKTQNRFTPLNSENIDDGSSEVESSHQTIPKPEPIFVTGVNKLQDLIETLNKTTDKEKYMITTMKTGHMVKILSSDVSTYKTIRNHLIEKDINHYTYQLKHEKPYRVVLRGMHHSVDKTEIIEGLASLGHKVRNIVNARHRLTKEPLPLFYIDLEPNPNNKKIFEVKQLLRMIVTFEAPYVKKEVVQCKRCQRFGHTKNFCHRPYRCVKCGENHATASCTKIRTTPPNCVNCNEPHTANYRGCKIYKDYKEQIYEPLKKKQPTIEAIKPIPLTKPPSLPTTSRKTYAQTVSQESATETYITQQNQPDMLQMMNHMFARFEQTFQGMMDRLFDLVMTIMTKK